MNEIKMNLNLFDNRFISINVSTKLKYCNYSVSVVSIDYSVCIFSYRFGLAVLLRCRDRKLPAQL